MGKQFGKGKTAVKIEHGSKRSMQYTSFSLKFHTLESTK